MRSSDQGLQSLALALSSVSPSDTRFMQMTIMSRIFYTSLFTQSVATKRENK